LQGGEVVAYTLDNSAGIRKSTETKYTVESAASRAEAVPGASFGDGGLFDGLGAGTVILDRDGEADRVSLNVADGGELDVTVLKNGRHVHIAADVAGGPYAGAAEATIDVSDGSATLGAQGRTLVAAGYDMLLPAGTVIYFKTATVALPDGTQIDENGYIIPPADNNPPTPGGGTGPITPNQPGDGGNGNGTDGADDGSGGDGADGGGAENGAEGGNGAGGSTVDFGDGSQLELPPGAAIGSDGGYHIPPGSSARLILADGEVIEVPGGFAVFEDLDAPLGFAFKFENPFTDVSEADWFYGDVAFTYLNGLFKGTSATTFSPDMPLSRGMIITVIGRLHGVDESAHGGASFDDVEAGAYYSAYAEWGKQNGIVEGVGANMYEPERAITREEMVAIFSRYVSFAGKTLEKAREPAEFADSGEISGYAAGYVAEMYEAGVLNGVGENRIDPQGTALRSEGAAIMHRLITALGLDGFYEPTL
jgi:hypothetical protein